MDRKKLDKSGRALLPIEKRWIKDSKNPKKNRIEATLEKEKALKSIKIKPLVGQSDYYNTNFERLWNKPPFVVPKAEDNANIINAILIQSWQIQTSLDDALSRIDACNFKIHGFMVYYFKCMPSIKQNIKFVVGQETMKNLADNSTPMAFMKIGSHHIHNAFPKNKFFRLACSETLLAKYWYDKLLIDEEPTTFKLSDPKDTQRLMEKWGEPATNLKIGAIQLNKLKLVCGRDEKMEQKLAYESSRYFYASSLVYDIQMRKFIEENYEIKIPSLSDKWSRLCWNCFTQIDKKMYCSKCLITQYCSKECQVQDWVVHKELHKMEGVRKSKNYDGDEPY